MAALIRIIQGLDPDMRHSLQIECRGAEPWKVSRIREHLDIQLKTGSSSKEKP